MKYNPIDVDSALYMMENDGPNFGLGILHVSEGEFLNEEGRSNCQAQNDAYRISIDEQGRSYLTGERDRFTCTAIETFVIEY